MAKAPILPIILGAGALYFFTRKESSSVSNKDIEKGLGGGEGDAGFEKELGKDVPGGEALDPGSYSGKVGDTILIDHSKLGGPSFQAYRDQSLIAPTQMAQTIEVSSGQSTLSVKFLKPGSYRFEFPIGPTAVWMFNISE